MEPVPKFSEFLKLHKLNLNFRSGVMCTNLDFVESTPEERRDSRRQQQRQWALTNSTTPT
jgi:hypothetical protein